MAYYQRLPLALSESRTKPIDMAARVSEQGAYVVAPLESMVNTVNSTVTIESNDLARRALAGCTDAFGQLAMRYTPRLIQTLQRRHRGNRADAEDVVQEALVRAFQKLSLYDQRFSFRTWLYTIAFRISTDHLRRSQKTSYSISLDGSSVEEKGPSVEKLAIQRELAGNIWAIAREVLNDSQYTALWLHVGEQMSACEVAMVMGKSTIGTRVTIHRAKRNLFPHVESLSLWDADCLTESSSGRNQHE